MEAWPLYAAQKYNIVVMVEKIKIEIPMNGSETGFVKRVRLAKSALIETVSTMANLTLELNIYSAKDLENVNLITKMDVYAVVWVDGDDSQKNHKEKTAVDRTGESEPTWNHAVKFSLDQRLAREGRLTLVVKLVCDRIFGGKDLGEVQVPVLELLNSSPSFNGDGNGNGLGMRFVTYQVRTPFGKGQGSLTFSYRFDMPSFKPDVPVSLVYPNPIDTSLDFPSTNCSPPSQGGFYPPPPSIGYPPSSQPQGYSAPPYLYPHQYDSPYPEHPIAAYPPSSSASYPPSSSTSNYPPSPSASNYPPSPSASNYPPSSSASSFYPPPHHPYLYPPPPDKPGHSYYQTQPSQSFHGYVPPSPQSQHGYGYPPGNGCPPTQTPPKKNKPGLGLGMGAGLLGGALGGLLLGDLVSDAFDF
ncbi:unnamed protein product [Microthlaspi erraticum]|uniref:C2 domain-containing protein n=1 Tax=Microthlaspi erraticum TaxID=1685480 RepID=A0A6D2HNJ2_9BRAS|nr:unnamed protein product [Microthlaspi erraticum]CAA7034487.1 unnamed protein product [Microthlaspi erraticum]